jgi:hypothetical protein
MIAVLPVAHGGPGSPSGTVHIFGLRRHRSPNLILAVSSWCDWWCLVRSSRVGTVSVSKVGGRCRLPTTIGGLSTPRTRSTMRTTFSFLCSDPDWWQLGLAWSTNVARWNRSPAPWRKLLKPAAWETDKKSRRDRRVLRIISNLSSMFSRQGTNNRHPPTSPFLL